MLSFHLPLSLGIWLALHNQAIRFVPQLQTPSADALLQSRHRLLRFLANRLLRCLVITC
ncbi:hypothetical protein MGSAQ_001936 [marine sediment metagenome]|uniref:Uncharacterized protein n=1 Tax=marine sediment metagenome TaxID=412755 RepID=A0A1B6NSV9_9ZZZZ